MADDPQALTLLGPPAGQLEPASEPAASPAERAHRRACSVCKHEASADAEACYAAGLPVALVARTFGLSESAVSRHMAVFGLQRARAGAVVNALADVLLTRLASMNPDDLGVDDVLRLADRLGKLAPALASQPAQLAGQPSSGQPAETWEQRVAIHTVRKT